MKSFKNKSKLSVKIDLNFDGNLVEGEVIGTVSRYGKEMFVFSYDRGATLVYLWEMQI